MESNIPFEFQTGTNEIFSHLVKEDPYHDENFSFDQTTSKQLKSFPVIECDNEEDTNEYEAIEKDIAEKNSLSTQDQNFNYIDKINNNSYKNETDSDPNPQVQAIDYVTIINEDNLLKKDEETPRPVTPKRLRLVDVDPKIRKENSIKRNKYKNEFKARNKGKLFNDDLKKQMKSSKSNKDFVFVRKYSRASVRSERNYDKEIGNECQNLSKAGNFKNENPRNTQNKKTNGKSKPLETPRKKLQNSDLNIKKDKIVEQEDLKNETEFLKNFKNKSYKNSKPSNDSMYTSKTQKDHELGSISKNTDKLSDTNEFVLEQHKKKVKHEYKKVLTNLTDKRTHKLVLNNESGSMNSGSDQNLQKFSSLTPRVERNTAFTQEREVNSDIRSYRKKIHPEELYKLNEEIESLQNEIQFECNSSKKYNKNEDSGNKIDSNPNLPKKSENCTNDPSKNEQQSLIDTNFDEELQEFNIKNQFRDPKNDYNNILNKSSPVQKMNANFNQNNLKQNEDQEKKWTKAFTNNDSDEVTSNELQKLKEFESEQHQSQLEINESVTNVNHFYDLVNQKNYLVEYDQNYNNFDYRDYQPENYDIKKEFTI